MSGVKTIQVTRELIQSGMSPGGGWTKEQLAILGVRWPPKTGWREWAERRQVSESEARRFVEMRPGGNMPGVVVKQKTLGRRGRVQDAIKNADGATAWCMRNGILLTVANGGAHWFMTFEDRRADFWPATGKLVFDFKFKEFLLAKGGWAEVAKILNARWPLKPSIDDEFRELVSSF